MHSWFDPNATESDSNATYDERVSDLIPSTCAGGRRGPPRQNDVRIVISPYVTPPREQKVQNSSMPQSINNINYQRNPLHLSGNLHKGDKFASTPTSSLSESESLLQLKQKIQKHPAPGDGARRLEQLVKQPFCATFRKTASSEANRINGAESSHKSELPEVHKECFNQFEAMKVKMEKMEEQLHMVQRQNNKNTENLDVCQLEKLAALEARRSYEQFIHGQMLQKQAASINLNKYKKINYDEQHTFFQNSICKCKSNNCTTFQMSFGRSSTSVLKQNDKIEKRFQRIEEQLNVERRAREDMYTQHSERFDKFDAKMEKMESNIDAKMEKMESNIDAKMEKMESNIDAKMEKMESNIDAKMEKMESNIDAKMEKMSLSIDAKFEKLSNIIIQMNNNEKKISDDYTLRV
ncbi:hypothetical protein ACQ4LE_006992 [Meloidogyne hapla]